MESPARPSILIVDDDPRVRAALKAFLEQEGYGVATAGDGQSGLAYLQSSGAPALILLDLMMPVMDGFEFRVRQLQQTSLAGVPVIVLSAGGDITRKTEGLHVAAVVSKPVDPEELLRIIARSI